MSRLFGAVLLGGFVVMVGAEAVRAAPAPLAKKRKEDALTQQVRRAAYHCGYRLHELRASPNPEEYSLVVSKLNAIGAGNEKPEVILAGPVPVKLLRNLDALPALLEIAELWGKLPEKERAKALVELTRSMPAKDRAVIEAYYYILLAKKTK
jgi:hypothetical protein